MESIRNVAVFASGQGTNLANLYAKAELFGSYRLQLLISNNSRSGAMEFAFQHGIRSEHLSLVSCGQDASRLQERMLQILREEEIDIIVLAGYMKHVPERVIAAFDGRILNVHPALLPAFGGGSMYGMRVHEAVIARGCKVSGATVHVVSMEYDEGPIVLQSCCEVSDVDTADSLREKVGVIEYELLPRAVDLLARNKLQIVGNRVIVKE